MVLVRVLGRLPAWALIGLLWLVLAAHARAEPQLLTQARVQTEIDGAPRTIDTTLPFVWDHWHKGRQGHAVFDIALPLAEVPNEPVLVYFTRLGNAYEVRLNGQLLERRGRLEQFDGNDYAQVPRLMTIPVGMLQHDNQLQIRIRADRARRAGLASPWVGTHDEIMPLYERDYLQRVTGTQFIVIMGLLVGTVALALWWTQVDPSQPLGRRREPLYLLAAIAEYMWTLRVGSALLAQPPLPRFWWDILFIEALGIWIAAMVMFSALAVDWHGRLSRTLLGRTLAILLVLGIGCAIGAQWGQLWLLTAWYASLGIVALAFVAEYSWAAVRGGSQLHRLIAAALVLNVGVGVRDWAVFRLQMAFGGNSLMRYSSLLFGLLLIYIVLRRFRAAAEQVRHLLATMAAQVAAKEQALQASYAQVELLAREQERVNERTRILRDLHDGVGAHISAAIRQLESGKASNDDVLQTLRDSLDQIKLSIDAMHLPAGDVTGLLANLRYRLEPKLAAADIALHWDVDWLAPVARLDAAGMRHLQHMVFESLSNVLQHARARELRIEAKAQGPGVRIRIEDNGVGFDSTRPVRNGLLSLRERARAIGAELDIQSRAGRTAVEITLG